MRIAMSLLAVVLTWCAAALAAAGGGPAETVVLVNTASEDSRRVAAAYVKARQIPPQQVCEVSCAASASVPIADFVRDVADPLRDFLRRRGLEERVSFVVMTQGMPIVAKTPGGDVSTSAALTLLHTAHCGENQVPVQQPWRNPLYQGGLAAQLPRSIPCAKFLHVTALLSVTADEAISLVERSVASDGTAPDGALWIFQDANGNAATRNAYYDAARAQLESLGAKTEHVAAGADKATGRKRVMAYMAGGAYSALTPDGVKTNEYLPGAICDHLQSFGAVPQNFDADPKNDTQFPIVHMVRAGITVVHGAVSEPYTIAFPDPDVFLAYLEGATAAETFWRRFPLGYWMNLVLGDPLCAPYAKRPAVKLATTGGRAVATAPGAKRIAIYVDGAEVASADGDSVEVALDPAALPAGPHHVLAQAVGEGTWEPRGWTSATVAGTGAAATAAAPRAGGAAKFGIDVPESAVAGEDVVLRVTPQDAAGAPLAKWTGRVEVRRTTPPVRVAKADVTDAAGAVEVPLRLTKAGDLDLVVSLADEGVRRTVKVRVAPGPVRNATTPLDRVPLGQACDVDVLAQDEFGNAASWDGEMRLTVPSDPFAEVPSPAAVARGRGVFRDVLFTKAGRQALAFADATGKRLSADGEGAEAVHAAIRAWLVAAPFRGDDAAKALAADPSQGADRDGCVAGARLWRRLRARGDDVSPPVPGTKDGDAVACVAFVKALNAGKVRFLAAGPNRIAVFLDGRPIFDGTPKQADVRGKREAVAEADLTEGVHRLAVVVQRKDRAVFSLEMDDGAGKHTDSVVVLASDGGAAPSKVVVSGRVRRGNAGAANAKVVVKGSDGQERTVTTGADGIWFVEGVPEGEATVTATWQHPLAPATRTVTVGDAHVCDVDFVAEDRTAPAVKLDGAAARFGKRIVLDPQVSDDDAVRDVRLLLDGQEVAKATAAPWRLDADVVSKARGKHEVVVVATDPAGNEGRSAPLAVQLIDDAKGPAVKVAGLANNAQMKKKTDVTATVTDDLPLASVRFRLDGKDVGEVRTKAPFECEVDPAGLAEGSHSLAVVARDLDGNETLVEVTFKVKK